ncbi:MAG: hypothetical protein AB7G06_08290 [Bdellovibrionales bacterium]
MSAIPVEAEDDIPVPFRPDEKNTREEGPVDFIVYYAGPNIASNQRMRGKLQGQLHPECKTWLTVCNQQLSQEEIVEQLIEKAANEVHDRDPDVVAEHLHMGERLHGGHGNRGPLGIMIDFIRTQMRLRSEGPSWKLYVEAQFPGIIRALRERGYDPIPYSGAVIRKRRKVYPWWLFPAK